MMKSGLYRGSETSAAKKTWFNAKEQRIKGSKQLKGKKRVFTTKGLDPLILCPFALNLLIHFDSRWS